MALLLDEDYAKLESRGLNIEEDEAQRAVVFTGYELTAGLYTVPMSNVLVLIPAGYNQAGNDMFWTFPQLIKADGQPIPRAAPNGYRHNRQFKGNEYCRWSRHWHPGQPGEWRAGIDDIISIQRRIDWALAHPHC